MVKKIIISGFIIIVILSALVSCAKNDRSGYMLSSFSYEGVDDTISEYQELTDAGFSKNKCCNITPDGFAGTVIKSKDNGKTAVVYDGSVCFLTEGGGYGMINGYAVAEGFLYSYSDGGLGAGVSLYSIKEKKIIEIYKTKTDIAPYLAKQSAENMPDVYSVLLTTVTVFDNSYADLGCVAISEIGVISKSGEVYTFRYYSDADIVDLKYEGIKKIVISSLPENETNYREYTGEELKTAAEILKKLTYKEKAENPPPGLVFTVTLHYEDGTASIIYISGNAMKIHGGEWYKLDGDFVIYDLLKIKK